MVFGRRAAFVLAAVAVLLPGLLRSSAGELATSQGKTVRIGVAESLCRDTDPTVLRAMIPPFRVLARSCTGQDCDLAYGGNAFQLATRLANGQLELGIFQG